MVRRLVIVHVAVHPTRVGDCARGRARARARATFECTSHPIRGVVQRRVADSSFVPWRDARDDGRATRSRERERERERERGRRRVGRRSVTRARTREVGAIASSIARTPKDARRRGNTRLESREGIPNTTSMDRTMMMATSCATCTSTRGCANERSGQRRGVRRNERILGRTTAEEARLKSRRGWRRRRREVREK